MIPKDPSAKLEEYLKADDKIIIKAKITPKSGHREISGILADGTVKIKLKSAPEQGKANEELTTLLAGFFKVSEKKIKIIKGHTSPLKTIEIERK